MSTKRVYTYTIETTDDFPTNGDAITVGETAATAINGVVTNIMYKESLISMVEHETVLGNFGVGNFGVL